MWPKKPRSSYKLKTHEKPYGAVHFSFAVKEGDCSDPLSQFPDGQACLAGKHILLRHIVFIHFNSKQCQLWNCQWKCKFFVPNGFPIVLFFLSLLHRLVRCCSCYANLPYRPHPVRLCRKVSS